MEITNTITLSAPWDIYRKKLLALFDKDEDIEVKGVTNDYELHIVSSNIRKFNALRNLLPPIKTFGNVTLRIIIDYKEEQAFNYRQAIKDLFNDNGRVTQIVDVKDPASISHVFVLFKPEVIQFFSDNMFDYNGLWSGLAQDLCTEIFEGAQTNCVHFSTDRVASNSPF